jgi:hypothetical protein
MADRSWFFAASGQQHGPYGEAQLYHLIARGVVTAETLVWTEGMAGWQTAGEVPGLLSAASRSPVTSRSSNTVMSAGGYGDGTLSIDFGILEFTWRSIVLALGLIVVIAAPWAVVWYVRWLVSCVEVPGRPNISFSGSALTAAAWYFGAIVVAICVAATEVNWLEDLDVGGSTRPVLALSQMAGRQYRR